MKTVRVKRRFFVVRLFRKWLYRLFKEQEALEQQARSWQRGPSKSEEPVPVCLYCQRPSEIGTLFCKYCGLALVTRSQNTTGQQRLVKVSPPVPPVTSNTPLAKMPYTFAPVPPSSTLTGQIESMVLPGEKYGRLKAYNRLQKKGTQA